MTQQTLLLLGVTPPSAPPVFSDTPHVRVPCESWTALALPVRLDPEDDEESRMTRWALSQGEVLCRQVRVSDVLPVRLGAVFTSGAALRAHVDALHRELAEVAGTCGGCVEFAVQAVADAGARDESAGAANLGGRAFLARRRMARDRRSQATSDRRGFLSGLDAALRPLAQIVTARDVQGRAPIADWSVLLRRGAVERLLCALEDLDAEASRHGLRLRVTGPWPPFAFIAGT
ncbi:MAG: GvpL/GvpF family gas vesicle protein [Roseicyclus sp.]